MLSTFVAWSTLHYWSCTLKDAIQVAEERAKRDWTNETIYDFCLVILSFFNNNIWPDYSKHIAFMEQIGLYFKFIPLIVLFGIFWIIKHVTDIFERTAKIYFILPAIKSIIFNLRTVFVDESITIYYVQHRAKSVVWIDKPNWIESITLTSLLQYEAAFNNFAPISSLLLLYKRITRFLLNVQRN